jgi:hypothetical protein
MRERSPSRLIVGHDAPIKHDGDSGLSCPRRASVPRIILLAGAPSWSAPYRQLHGYGDKTVSRGLWWSCARSSLARRPVASSPVPSWADACTGAVGAVPQCRMPAGGRP